jgi:hypothetical protein
MFYSVRAPAGQVVQVAPYRPRRLSLAVYNVSDFRCYIAPWRDFIRERGWPLAPGSALILLDADGDKPGLEYYALCEGNAELRVIEGVP